LPAHREPSRPRVPEDLPPLARAIRIERASFRDGAPLAEISQRAFEAAAEYGGRGAHVPPGHAEPRWQMRMMFAAKYFKIIYGEKLVGGFIVFDRDEAAELERIFIDPDYQRRGLGLWAMRRLERLFPDGRRWVLASPFWNKRLQGFWRRSGFGPTGRETGVNGAPVVLYGKRGGVGGWGSGKGIYAGRRAPGPYGQ
jgi:GNAT superfamily N-acetyltransferase